MRPTISWSDLTGARVGVWGLGVEGHANLRRLRLLGVEPVLVDDHPAPGDHSVLATDRGGLDALERCEVVVKTPGISRHRADVRSLAARGIPVVGGLGLWMQEVDRSRVICVTGTKGKSTTTAILGHLLTRFGRRCVVGGNLGRPPYDPDVDQHPDVWVIEISSYQATDLASSPPIVAVTSLFPDHLDWHGDAETYYRDKLSACTQPGARITVADGGSDVLRQHTGLLGPRIAWVDGNEPWSDALGLRGAHNARNAAIARAVLVDFGVASAEDPDAMAAAAAGFQPLASRLQTIGTVAGVEFVDDSLSTNVLPTLAAVAALADRPLALIVGGYDRGIDYAPLAEQLAARAAPTLVLGIPDSGPRILAALAARTGAAAAEACTDLAAAVTRGFTWARPTGGVVLLSPAAASFGRFRDYRERSAAFATAMRSCTGPDR